MMPPSSNSHTRIPWRTGVRGVVAWALVTGATVAAHAQVRRPLTLDDALALAEATSEQVTIAEAGVNRAESAEQRVKSERKPQLSSALSYDRTLDSEFRGLFDSGGEPTCDPLTVRPDASLADRVGELERAYDCQPASSPFGSGGNDLPFGQDNAYRLNLSLSQSLFTGGRLAAQERQASLGRRSADLGLTSTRAQVSYDVSQAYYDAALSDRLVAIAEETLAQADRTFEQTRAQREAGRQSEFDLLRAQVARDTLRPQIIQRRAVRDLAHLRLKQLLELPADTQLDLVARLDDDVLPPPERFAPGLADAATAGVSKVGGRLALSQLQNDVSVREAAIDVVRAQRWPSVSLNSSYGRVGYRGYPTWPRTNWTVGASVSMPLLTGGRISAEEASARADLDETRARLKLAEELAQLDAESARLDVASSLAAWQATADTIQQAQRAYEIAELRYREGLSTQLELSDARLLLEQAQVNRALAARNVQVARARLALLPDLPLTTAAGVVSQALQAAATPVQTAAQTTAGAQR
ncbi:MAG: TolC family protein [Vicinamibacterales bacterium]